MALTEIDRLVLDAMLAFESAKTLGEQQDAIEPVIDLINDLLTACKRLLEEIHDQGYDYYNTPILGAIEQAQEAIAKAEPKTP